MSTTFPFTMFGGEWTERALDIVTGMPSRGDTVVGNDVWFGYQATVMPEVTIGDGAVIAAGAVSPPTSPRTRSSAETRAGPSAASPTPTSNDWCGPPGGTGPPTW
ncbi:hypothetical protein [Nonomuraea sp. JJY05]|uniref:hypothetical protein n=1 Tax=Nonomuraea sp. JJY05 TaxID=3350255 RepID=UPI00373EB595